MRRARTGAVLALAILATVALVAGCGAPERLSDEDGRELAGAREDLDDALDTEETLRTSATEARRLRARVRRIVSDGSFEAERLDEFGIAKLGLLREAVPSLVIEDANGAPRALDRPATAAFLRFAERDAPRALLRPATRAVETMVTTLDGSDAGPDTEIPGVRASAGAYLREAERDVKDIWPALAERLADAEAAA
ncbi:MAG: hypothetical protein ACR2GL_03230 [Thermoleophilaceae bacterium]